MEPLKIKISDSAVLMAVNTDKFKKNLLSMSVFLPVGSGTTPCDLLFPGVLLRGTSTYPTNADVKRRLEELYAARINVNGGYYGDSLATGFLAEFLNDGAVGGGFPILQGVIDILSDIWHRPATDAGGLLRADEVRMAKNSLIDTIRSEINNTALYATNRTRELMCPGEPYGYSVTEDEVNAVTAAGLTERYRYVRDSSYVTFSYIGSRPAEEVAALLRAAFPAAPDCRDGNGDGNGIKKPAVKATEPAEPVLREVRMPVTQGKLTMGFTSGGVVIDDSDDYYAMCLFADVFGGLPSSKLFMNVRERLGLCYYCGAYYENYKGIIYVSSGIDTANKDAVKNEVLRQLEAMQNGQISNAELEAAALSVCNSYRQIEDNPFSMLSFCFGRLTLGLDCSPEAFVKRIMSVKIPDIVKAAGRVKLKAVYFLAGTDASGAGGKEGSDE